MTVGVTANPTEMVLIGILLLFLSSSRRWKIAGQEFKNERSQDIHTRGFK